MKPHIVTVKNPFGRIVLDERVSSKYAAKVRARYHKETQPEQNTIIIQRPDGTEVRL